MQLLLIISIVLVFMLPSCSKHPKKIVFDRNTQIDCALSEDEYVSHGERIHAKDIARQANELVNNELLEPGLSYLAMATPELIALYEAKLADIPIPLGALPMQEYFQALSADSSQLVLGYVSDQPIAELVQFYTTQMEPFGWRLVQTFHAAEQLLVFAKGDQQCIVSLRVHEGWFYQSVRTHLILFVSGA